MNTSNAITGSRLIAFTTPENYAGRLSHRIHLKGWTPLWCPTIAVEPTTQTKSSLLHYLSPPNPLLDQFSALAFTSRSGISAFSDALLELNSPPLSPSGEPFTISALGKDADLIDNSFIGRICDNSRRIKLLVPEIATPAGLARALGLGRGRKVLCPVPLVVGLEEPRVVPDFLRDLVSKGWVAVRVNAYETRWMGAVCAAALLRKDGSPAVDAIVFTSTGEVEGMLKSLRVMGLDWETVRRENPAMVVAAHGPVTAAGAESLGVGVDVVSSRFSSFDGVVDALALLMDD
ncbi:uncharacterized protein LOC112515167 [Cynara cardunculus var. scolymus]|uniref:Tetrapyrrole biosynthesis, uroporphyrinogen III synthase n=1 Tax=Cynara cardunculus var. scolymus TaxID=59895 RepID=A0A103XJX2_CYNCS|nr:uncharacterized protein LOC112515167 [Cynara cardunculus var. scolymus]KVH92133.1 Tetrapyrrole biosynthesis, uroporphyrinogen III synthase [Cynara cardunculus var. scolymus]